MISCTQKMTPPHPVIKTLFHGMASCALTISLCSSLCSTQALAISAHLDSHHTKFEELAEENLSQIRLSSQTHQSIQSLQENDDKGQGIAEDCARDSLLKLLMEKDTQYFSKMIQILSKVAGRSHNRFTLLNLILNLDQMVKVHYSETLGEAKRWVRMSEILAEAKLTADKYSDGDSEHYDIYAFSNSSLNPLKEQMSQVDPRIFNIFYDRYGRIVGSNDIQYDLAEIGVIYDKEMVSDRLVNQALMVKHERNQTRKLQRRNTELSKGIYCGTVRKTVVKFMDRLMRRGSFSKENSYPLAPNI